MWLIRASQPFRFDVLLALISHPGHHDKRQAKMTIDRLMLRNTLFGMLIPLALGACAPDAWNASDPFSDFLDQVRNKCWNEQIGRRGIPQLMPTPNQVEPSFMDMTSRLYFGKITEQEYRSSLEGFLGAKPDSPGINCIIQQLPPRAPAAPKPTPFSR
jgi:hypothetical protein